MALTYGYLKAKIDSDTTLKSSRRPHELQYHLHTTMLATAADGSAAPWDTAINVGTTDSDDLLQYKLVYDFRHPMTTALRAAAQGFSDMTGTAATPALDFLRSDLLTSTGMWRPSDVMDGSEVVEPVASLLRLMTNARNANADAYIFGRSYTGGDLGVHDVHMNQGSSGGFVNHGNDSNDHNDIWQDGALMVDLGDAGWAAYFPAFQQQDVPTNDLGNPIADAHPITASDDGSLLHD
jgi:uncharacterized protein YukJ